MTSLGNVNELTVNAAQEIGLRDKRVCKVGELSRGQVTKGLECQVIQKGKGCGPICGLKFIHSSNMHLLNT